MTRSRILILLLNISTLLFVVFGVQSTTVAGTLDSLVSGIAKCKSSNILERGKDWARISFSCLPNLQFVARTIHPECRLAERLIAIQDTTIVFVLESEKGGPDYSSLLINGFDSFGADIKCWTATHGGGVDRVFVQDYTSRKGIFIGDPNGVHSFLSATPDGNLWLLLSDPARKDYTSFLHFDRTTRSYRIAALMSTQSHSLIDVYVMSDQGDWIEYVFSDSLNRVVAVGRHDKSQGRLKELILDPYHQFSATAFILRADSIAAWKLAASSIDYSRIMDEDTWNALAVSLSEIEISYHRLKVLIGDLDWYGLRLPRVVIMPD